MKSAFGFVVAFRGAALLGLGPETALMLGGLAFVFPYFLFCGLSGAWIERVGPVRVIFWTRVSEVPLSLVTVFALMSANPVALLCCLCLYSVQTAFFAPAKLASVPLMVKAPDLPVLNANLQFATLSGGLFGLLAGGLLVGSGSEAFLAAMLVLVSVVGFVLARQLMLDAAGPTHARPQNRPKLLGSIRQSLLALIETPTMLKAALCISWFWVLALIMTTILPEVASAILGLTAMAANGLFAAFVVGVFGGALLQAFLVRWLGRAPPLPLSLIGITLFILDFSFALQGVKLPAPGFQTTLADFAATSTGLRMLIDLSGLAICATLFVSPVYAMMQQLAPPAQRGRVLAASPILDSLILTLVSGAVVWAFAFDLSVPMLLIAMGLANLLLAMVLGLVFLRIRHL